jgi:hypothetical protein
MVTKNPAISRNASAAASPPLLKSREVRSCVYEPCSKMVLMRVREGQRFCSHSCAMLSQVQRGKDSPNWRGDDVGYWAQHDRVEAVRGKADHCIHRNAIGCTSMTFDWAWIHGQNRNDVYSYVPMCRSCHKHYDATHAPHPGAQGSKNVNAKLTEEIVLVCRARHYQGNESQSALAREFGVHPAVMRRAVIGETWAMVPMPPIPALAKLGASR